jgi:hypothetical protein
MTYAMRLHGFSYKQPELSESLPAGDTNLFPVEQTVFNRLSRFVDPFTANSDVELDEQQSKTVMDVKFTAYE